MDKAGGGAVAVNHVVAIHPEQRPNGEVFYRSVCTCGYRSGLRRYPGRWVGAGEELR